MRVRTKAVGHMGNNVQEKSARKRAREKYWSEYDKGEYQCPDCGRSIREVERFEIHHRNGMVHDNNLENLVGLCKVCHAIREGRNPGIEAIERLRDELLRSSRNSCMEDSYWDLHLAAYTKTQKSVSDDPDAMLAACVRARAAGDVARSAEPPNFALVPILRDAGMDKGPDEIKSGTRDMILDVFYEISLEDVQDDDTVEIYD